LPENQFDRFEMASSILENGFKLENVENEIMAIQKDKALKPHAEHFHKLSV